MAVLVDCYSSLREMKNTSVIFPKNHIFPHISKNENWSSFVRIHLNFVKLLRVVVSIIHLLWTLIVKGYFWSTLTNPLLKSKTLLLKLKTRYSMVDIYLWINSMGPWWIFDIFAVIFDWSVSACFPPERQRFPLVPQIGPSVSQPVFTRALSWLKA